MFRRICFVFVLTISTVTNAQTNYVPLITVDDDNFYHVALNDAGEILGRYRYQDGLYNVAIYDTNDRSLSIIPNPDGYVSAVANSMNDKGQIVGNIQTNLTLSSRKAFIYNNGVWNIFGDSKYEAIDINNNGVVVGNVSTDNIGDQTFIYSNGNTQILGNSIVGYDLKSRVSGVNDKETLIGLAYKIPYSYQGDYYAFRYNSNTGLTKILEIPHIFSKAKVINNNNEIIGTFGTHRSTGYAFLSRDDGVLEIITDNRYTYISVNGLNDQGTVIGRSHIDTWGGYGKSFVYSDGVKQDLNNLAVPTQQFVDIDYVQSINNAGQIIAKGRTSGPYGVYKNIILNPIPFAPSNFVAEKQVEPINRLARWNKETESFVPVSPDEITSGKVHILTHGWAPGMRDLIDEKSDNRFPLAWDSDINWAPWMAEMAQTISDMDSEENTVLAFSWVDKSATSSSLVAGESRKHTDEQGFTLFRALVSAIDNDVWNGSLHLIGHSHGSRVVTTTALALEQGGIDVNGLTILDSPEGFWSGIASGTNGLNQLLEIIESKFGIGQGKTFVDNYISEFGKSYGAPGVVNVELFPDHISGWSEDHGYSTTWYKESLGSGVGLDWYFSGGVPAGEYYQDWRTSDGVDYSRQFAITEKTIANILPVIVQTTFMPVGFHSVGTLVDITNGIRATEQSPVYWYSSFIIPENAIAMSFVYEWLALGDGDQLGIWIDEELVFLVTGEVVGFGEQFGWIDLAEFEPRLHFMTVALHSAGDTNASFEVRDFQMISTIPEPASGIILVFSSFLIFKRKKRK